MSQLVMWFFFILPWLSLLFMERAALKRYMPVALLATVLNTIVYQMAWKYGWWKYKETLFSWDKVAQAHTVYAAFLVGTIWIFRFTFRRFWLYMLVNIGVDCIYAFGLRALWKKLGITAGGNLPPLGSLSIMVGLAVLLYVYQLWQETIFISEPEKPTNQAKITFVSSSVRRLRMRAR